MPTGGETARDILCSVGEVLYEWSLKDDGLAWGPNVCDVLGVEGTSLVATGKGFAALLDPDNLVTPYDTIQGSAQRDAGEGVAYQIQYALRPHGPKAHWIW